MDESFLGYPRYLRARDFEQNSALPRPVARRLHRVLSRLSGGLDRYGLGARTRALAARLYQPRSRPTKIFRSVRGKLWIDRLSYQWVKVEAEVIQPVSWGLFLVRLDSGAKVSMEQTRVNDEVWLTKRVLATGSARIGLFKKMRAHEEIALRQFRKFQTDARLVATQP